jgi:hypothetical protein
MALLNLIKDQTIIIDNHKRGTGEANRWDKSVHIHKTTHREIEGKRQEVELRIPINSNQKIDVRVEGVNKGKVPKSLMKEIRGAFEDVEKRELFINELVKQLKNYSTILQTAERAAGVLDLLSKHFELKWTGEKILHYANNALISYTQIYKNDKRETFYGSVTDKGDKESIKFEQKSEPKRP